MDKSTSVAELERLFRLIVANLSATDPSRLRLPLPLGDLRNSIVPYRANRRALQLESSEDYELALMCLAAGMGGFAQTEPEDIQAAFATEIDSPNPDLTLVQQHEHATLTLNPRAVAVITTPTDPHLSFAPPQPVEIPAKAAPKKRRAVQDAKPTSPSQCSRCRGHLPSGRVVNFCPECGFDLRRAYCPQCNTELEPEWRHCVSCGLSLSRG